MQSIHTGDNVKMLAGKDRGKTGKVLHVFPTRNRVLVEGLNKIKRHTRARQQGQKGQIIEREQAVNFSNIQLICAKCNKATRVGFRLEGETKVRFCKRCKAIT
ncbi:MAG: 50S ribosomal protein L24 [Candidatus Yanofskybacteria bacterium CG10_big_fil_rev_8_21_14_0_10_46_23]|uniref:Large ribosomal subunit protein uL24 n=1 Tax=Candidatus Yanofskybacteria bacterium CG10_big_fil_rev_8_21_14_0_10_46_23 TaxID=1975098 RepID=A0A2H0R3U5_9BACT|nr:MAG: 50S ribosomal protein L24 [Candidatus Yanofskybacteria bacterium CG10_big_fil_rev_8_21_14_0_10_46_23]